MVRTSARTPSFRTACRSKSCRRSLRFGAVHATQRGLVGERASLDHGVDVVVGTPGPVHDHLVRARLELSGIRTLVLDEADRMLEMGFVETVGAIARAVPGASDLAVLGDLPRGGARGELDVPARARCTVIAADDVAARITQVVYDAERTERMPALIRILEHHRPGSAKRVRTVFPSTSRNRTCRHRR
jgi:ATP-independent RNA helicase DbpA